jgi:hypothetical protein
MAIDLAAVKEREWFCTYHSDSANRHTALPVCGICEQDTVLGDQCFEMRPALDKRRICMPTIRQLWVHDVCGRCIGSTLCYCLVCILLLFIYFSVCRGFTRRSSGVIGVVEPR